MGLDAVEIVMEVEAAFGIEIKDSEAGILRTPGQLIDYVITKVNVIDAKGCLSQRAFYLCRSFCVRSWAFDRGQIKPNVVLNDLVPRHRRRDFVAAFSQYLSVAPPRLVRPTTAVAPLMVGVSFAGLAVTLSLIHQLGPMATWAGLATVIAAGIISERVTRGLRTDFPKELNTIGDLSHWLMTMKSDLVIPPTTAWSREQIAERVKAIVIETLGCEAKYREDADFVKDLGLS